MLKLQQLHEYHNFIVIFQILNTRSPKILSEHFKFMSDITIRNTPQGDSLLSVPIHYTTVYSNSFTISACRLWNLLPDNNSRSEAHSLRGRDQEPVAVGSEGNGWVA